MKFKAAFFSDDLGALNRVYGAKQRARLKSLVSLLPACHGTAELAAPRSALAGVEVVFSTWGMPALGPKDLKSFPALMAVFYAAGSVRGFAAPLLDRGIAVFSAWAANAEPVAEFTLAQILLAGKRFLPGQAALRRGGADAWSSLGVPGNAGAQVALLGAGMVGRRVIELLKPFHFKVLVFDPFLKAQTAKALGVKKVGLAQAFARSQVVSNHLSDVPETRGLITQALILSLPGQATFINTGRGATVDEAGLWRALTLRPDLCAILDVTNPEPPAPGSPAYSLENVFLSPHVSGSLGKEQERMADLIIDEFEAWRSGRSTRFRVSAKMLKTMA